MLAANMVEGKSLRQVCHKLSRPLSPATSRRRLSALPGAGMKLKAKGKRRP
jgi:hypothetical protein